jgi:hypothetical protein
VRTLAGAFLSAICCLLLWSCSGDKPKSEAGGVTLPPSSSSGSNAAGASSSSSGSDESKVDVCAFFTQADAESIMGAAMKLSAKTHPGRNCMYEEVKARPNSLTNGMVTLTLSQSKSIDDENKSWAGLKETRHLQAGEKNVHALSGIGDEAYFTGNTEKGKVGVAAVVARKGKSELMLDSMVMEYVASPDAMKKVAKKIADQLQ